MCRPKDEDLVKDLWIQEIETPFQTVIRRHNAGFHRSSNSSRDKRKWEKGDSERHAIPNSRKRRLDRWLVSKGVTRLLWWIQWISNPNGDNTFAIRFETQDIKTQPQINHNMNSLTFSSSSFSIYRSIIFHLPIIYLFHLLRDKFWRILILLPNAMSHQENTFWFVD